MSKNRNYNDGNRAQRNVQAHHSSDKSEWSARGAWSSRCDTASGTGGLVRYFSDERVRIFNSHCRCPTSQHCSRITYNPARVDRLQLKPSKCPLRIRSPIGDGARLTAFLGGLLLPFDGILPLVGLLGKAVFGGTAGGWSLPPNPGCGLENDVLRERRRKRPLARS